MGFPVMLWGAEKLVPAEYWCPFGTDGFKKERIIKCQVLETLQIHADFITSTNDDE